MLTGAAITAAVESGQISIEPFDKDQINPNSYDVRLGDDIVMVMTSHHEGHVEREGVYGGRYSCDTLDVREPYETMPVSWSPEGATLLLPGRLYLGHTKEWTYTPHHVPMFNGKSTCARYGISVHQTGGFGDIGFRGVWTLEISVVEPIRVYYNMRIGQLCFFEVTGEVSMSYLDTGHYADGIEAVAGKPEAVK